MEEYEIAIIGGGVAGLVFSTFVNDYPTILLEKEKIDTTAGVSYKSTFPDIVASLSLEEFSVAKYTSFCMRSVNDYHTAVHCDRIIFELIDIGQFKGYLKEQAQQSSTVREQCEVVDIRSGPGHYIIEALDGGDERREYAAHYIVDASGSAFLSRKIFQLPHSDMYIHMLGRVIEGGYHGDAMMLQFIGGMDDWRCGASLYPFHKHDCWFGIGHHLPHRESPLELLREQFYRAVDLPIMEGVIEGGEQRSWDHGISPCGISTPLVYDRIIYIGDSAGQATPWTIEGIRPTLEACVMAAEAVKKSIAANDPELLWIYQEAWDAKYQQTYEGYDYERKWNRALEEWDRSIIHHHPRILRDFGNDGFVSYIRYADPNC